MAFIVVARTVGIGMNTEDESGLAVKIHGLLEVSNTLALISPGFQWSSRGINEPVSKSQLQTGLP